MLKNVTATPAPFPRPPAPPPAPKKKICLSREEPFKAWNNVSCYIWIFTLDLF